MGVLFYGRAGEILDDGVAIASGFGDDVRDHGRVDTLGGHRDGLTSGMVVVAIEIAIPQPAVDELHRAWGTLFEG